MRRTIHVAHSPDSDVAFMFWALAANKLDTGDLRYVHELADIETLNRRALSGELEVSAVSIHAYAHLADRYALLGCGASMGDGYGPRVVARPAPPPDPRATLRGLRVAVPGLLTTAYLALRLYQPDVEAVVVPFDGIEQAVLGGEVEAGLLIHEGQLTYADAGLNLWTDLGSWWLAETGLPLPLGGNVVRRDLGDAVIAQIARDLRASIQYGLEHRASALAHAARYSRGLSEAHTDQFVGMYVNQWTVDWGPRGRRAVQLLLDRGAAAGVIPARVALEFVG
ncbi:MAG TPA: MqnA/MqnD/SBP family protein [Gemmatimonadales bacterium]|nr:MqnA/MqnD/SBP family protein [Gemmatimonadales bacterium]